jgi:thymidylate synthase (FAD)
MKIVKQGWSWHTVPPLYRDMVFSIASAARNCYQSELKPLEEEEKFIRNLIKRGHHSPLEHISLSLKIITDRGVSHELVRHRLSSFSQESTRYVKYDDVEFILPVWVEEDFSVVSNMGYVLWSRACAESESRYKGLLLENWTPQQARTVLNMSLKTSVIVSSNIRQWRLILQQRTAKDAHPQMRELMNSILESFKNEFPCFFGDL